MAAGPHDLIEDPDIKKIWEGWHLRSLIHTRAEGGYPEGRWRGAVKCRVFADGNA
jgi:hypothetical protein